MTDKHTGPRSAGPEAGAARPGATTAEDAFMPAGAAALPVDEAALRALAADQAGREEVRIPLVEEELRVAKREVVRGRIQVRTAVETVEEIARAELSQVSVEVTRVPIGREVDVAPAIRTEGDVTIVPILEEILVVEKRLVLKEELHLRRRTETELVEVPVTLRRQRPIVERQEGDGTAGGGMAPTDESGDAAP